MQKQRIKKTEKKRQNWMIYFNKKQKGEEREWERQPKFVTTK
jgi:hypothetical protein